VELDAVITAQQAQAYKPSLKLFELAQKRIGADHRESTTLRRHNR
jgi:FMN phosphatase YigB (HAD superfamily)